MRRPFLPATTLLALGLLPATAGADFADPEKLPSRPELPDPLVMLDGGRVATKEQWVHKRRPELMALFEHFMYGRLPRPRPVEGEVRHEDR